MNHRSALAVLASLCVIAAASCSHAPRTGDQPGAEWLDATGAAHQPLETDDRPATVLLFISPDCPISNAYAPEVVRMASEYAPRRVKFFAVHSDPRVSPDVARRHAQEYGYPFPVLLDPTQTLARRVNATVTPEAAVFDAEERLVYRGRIDDLYYEFGRRRSAATRHDLRNAIDAVLARPRAYVRGAPPAVGCEIPPPPAPSPVAVEER